MEHNKANFIGIPLLVLLLASFGRADAQQSTSVVNVKPKSQSAPTPVALPKQSTAKTEKTKANIAPTSTAVPKPISAPTPIVVSKQKAPAVEKRAKPNQARLNIAPPAPTAAIAQPRRRADQPGADSAIEGKKEMRTERRPYVGGGDSKPQGAAGRNE